MKICIIKPGARIVYGSNATSGGTGEALSIIKILTEANFEVHAWTKILKKDKISTTFKTIEIEENYKRINEFNYDALIIINGNVNYFGGKDSPHDTLTYNIINNFKGPVFYCLCDPNILLTQIWNNISKKTWCSNYNKKDLEIIRDDIIYISQPRNISLLEELIKKKTHINIKKIIHFPFEKFVYLNMNDEYINEYEYDLIYGGTFRGGKREEDMIKFYFGYSSNIKVKMFGKIKKLDFKKNINNLIYPNFGSAVPYEKFNIEMKKGLATIIIGDPLYKKLDDIAQRTYESILIGNIVFIDKSYDKNKIVFGKNETLNNFSYVENRIDIEKRLNLLKNNPDYIKKIVELQKETIKFDKNEYINSFKNILKTYI